jgi:hypothetical protein
MPDAPNTNKPDIQSESIDLMTKVPFGAIIGSPLKAAVEAQAAAAIACADFIQKVGFTKDKDGKLSITNVDLILERQTSAQGAGGPGVPPTVAKFSMSVPLLSMLPIPFIRIESLTANFKVAISAIDERSQSEKDTLDLDGKLEASVGWGPLKVGASGGISSKKDSTATNTSKYSVEQTMDISLHAVQDDLPAGLAKLLDILKDEIKLIPAPAQ